MALTYPIGTIPISEIPDLRPLSDMCWAGEDLAMFVIYRFDPKCDEVRRRLTISEKDEMAAKLSGYKPTDDDQETFLEMTTCFLRILNSMDWEVMCTMEIAHDESMQVLRLPIGLNADEKALRAIDLKQKVIAGLSRIESELVTRRQKLADGDDRAASILLETAPDRKFRHNTLTGKKEAIE